MNIVLHSFESCLRRSCRLKQFLVVDVDSVRGRYKLIDNVGAF